MTTAWANLTHGRLVDALRAHVAGTFLAVLALAGAAWALVVAARGKRTTWLHGETTLAVAAVALSMLLLVEWTYRLFTQ